MTRIFIALCCAVAIAAVACSGGSPSSPSSVGATISGTVVSTPAGASAAAATSSALIVSVSGTRLSTGVDPSGRFRLGGVPPGDVQLTFRSEGATSTVALANVADQEVIELEVVIAGGTATVVNEARGNSDKQRRVVRIKKFTNGQDADEAPGPTIAVGATVTWTYVVTNESPLAFTRMSVTDDRGVEVRCPRELPSPGGSITCTGSGIAVAGPYRNVGTVTVMVNGSEHTSSDPSHYFGGSARGVTIRKFTNGQHVSEAPGPRIPVGSPVSWTYVVTNTSAFTFSSLSVTDDRGVTVACPRELPPPGASITCTGSGTAVAGQYRNVGTVTATANGVQYTDRDESFYFGGTTEESPKVQLCHRTGNGSYHMIEVSINAEPAHRAHGDGKPGETVPGSPGRVFTATCGLR